MLVIILYFSKQEYFTEIRRKHLICDKDLKIIVRVSYHQEANGFNIYLRF